MHKVIQFRFEMERIHKLLIEFMPSYTIKTAIIDKEDDALYTEFRNYADACDADPKLIYLLYIPHLPENNLTLLGAQDSQYYTIIVGKHNLNICSDCERNEFRLNLEKIQESANINYLVCDICMDEVTRTHGCLCKYSICSKCEITMIYNAIRETGTDVISCPNCRCKDHILSDDTVPYENLLLALLRRMKRYSDMNLLQEQFVNEICAEITASIEALEE